MVYRRAPNILASRLGFSSGSDGTVEAGGVIGQLLRQCGASLTVFMEFNGDRIVI